MPKVLISPEGEIWWGSSRLRCWWVAEKWDDAEIWRDGEPLSLEGLEFFITQHKTVHEGMPEVYKACRDRGVKVIWDLVDPLHWWMGASSAMKDHVDFVVTSTDALAAVVRQELELPAVCIPDRHKVEAFTAKKHEQTDCPTLMWHGVALNRCSLWHCTAELHRAYAMGLKFRVLIVDNAPKVGCQELSLLEGFPVEYEEWSLDKFYSETLTKADIGLVPPFPGSWGRLKSNNKETCFHIAGIPTTEGDDLGQLLMLIRDGDLRKSMGKQLRKRAVRLHRTEESVEEWKRLVKALS